MFALRVEVSIQFLRIRPTRSNQALHSSAGRLSKFVEFPSLEFVTLHKPSELAASICREVSTLQDQIVQFSMIFGVAAQPSMQIRIHSLENLYQESIVLKKSKIPTAWCALFSPGIRRSTTSRVLSSNGLG